MAKADESGNVLLLLCIPCPDVRIAENPHGKWVKASGEYVKANYGASLCAGVVFYSEIADNARRS